MEYAFNNDKSYTLENKQFINIGFQGVKFKTDKDREMFFVEQVMHEHMHKAIEKVTNTDTCIKFDLIQHLIQFFIFPEMEEVHSRNGFRTMSNKEIRIYYNMEV